MLGRAVSCSVTCKEKGTVVMKVLRIERTEMSAREWLAKMLCASLAFAVAIAAGIGMLYAGTMAVAASPEAHNEWLLWTVALAEISMIWGLPGMAAWVNRSLLAVIMRPHKCTAAKDN